MFNEHPHKNVSHGIPICEVNAIATYDVYHIKSPYEMNIITWNLYLCNVKDATAMYHKKMSMSSVTIYLFPLKNI